MTKQQERLVAMMAARKNVPKKDASGGGTGKNAGRGCKTPKKTRQGKSRRRK